MVFAFPFGVLGYCLPNLNNDLQNSNHKYGSSWTFMIISFRIMMVCIMYLVTCASHHSCAL
jgi:hypothetical protein